MSSWGPAALTLLADTVRETGTYALSLSPPPPLDSHTPRMAVNRLLMMVAIRGGSDGMVEADVISVCWNEVEKEVER